MHIPPELVEQLRKAQRVTVLTGAGISAESGVPTFRDALTGIWAKVSMEDVATPNAFRKNPRLVWDWWESWKNDLIARVQPNPGHRALAEMEKRFPLFTLITQNVDGLHQQAGSKDVIELHGSIHRIKCFDEDEIVEAWDKGRETPPRCPRCGGFLRHDIVWFEESLPEQALMRAYERSEACEVFLSIGTSTVVYPAADLPFTALRHGATVVEINPGETPLTAQARYVINDAAGVVLPELLKAL